METSESYFFELNQKRELTKDEQAEEEIFIMLFMREFFEGKKRGIGYDLTWGDLALIRNISHHVIADIEQHKKEIEDALRQKDFARANNITDMMPSNYEVETLRRFLSQRFNGLTPEQLIKNYPGKKGGEFLKRIRDGQEYL